MAQSNNPEQSTTPVDSQMSVVKPPDGSTAANVEGPTDPFHSASMSSPASPVTQADISAPVPSTQSPITHSMSELSNVTQAPTTPPSNLSAPVPSSTPAEHRQDTDADPKISALHGMFPDFDTMILQTVLEASDGDQDRAIDMLLGMSDPEYRPQPTAPQPQSQTQLDEELARRLYLEEQQAEQQYMSEHQYQQQQVPYQPRQGGSHRPQAAGQGHGPTTGGFGEQFRSLISGASSKVASSGFGRGGQGNSGTNPGTNPAAPGAGSAEFRQQFNELAETGKKHFNTLFTKVKAKIQEYENPPPGGQAGPSGQQPLEYSQGAPPRPTFTQQGAPQLYQNMAASTTRPVVAAQPQPQPHLNPNPAPSLSGYDVNVNPPTPVNAPEPPRETLPTTTTPPASGLGTAPSMAQRSSFDQPTSAPRASFDTSRLGLKPKRPVALGSSTTPSETPAHPKDNSRHNDDDDIEYVTSPFEDR
ncbi:hypothetical protein FRB99_004459 [Tulasnella sp. 403]|nr:hypothetical protein FRB99_004459 [Tulasnella sp. 403]